MFRKTLKAAPWAMMLLLAASSAFAAGGGGATELVVVADTRVISNSIMRYFADIYNTDPWMTAVWSVVATSVYGAFLALLMDFLISKTGIDLKKRKIVEH